MVQMITVENAVGMVLAHDMTRIIVGESKGPAFRKGHVIREKDIPVLLSMGKEHIYALNLSPDQIHEDEAASRIARAAAGAGITFSEAKEGRISLVAERSGLLKIDVEALRQLNRLEGIVFATRHTNHRVTQGTAVAGTRIVPLFMADRLLAEAEKVCRSANPLIQVKPFVPFKIGMIVTGSEIYHGRIKDTFSPVVSRKFETLGSTVFRKVMVSDDRAETVKAIHDLVGRGADMVVLTGGMSVDPDDQTPGSIRDTGASVVTYGAPVLPGAMFMLAYLGDVPVLGLPGCVMYHSTTIFDLIISRILAGDRIGREDFADLGHGGLCSGCSVCRYPDCGFGKA